MAVVGGAGGRPRPGARDRGPRPSPRGGVLSGPAATITLRAAIAEDRAAAEALLAAAGLPLAGFAEHLATAVVAEADGEVVGCVTVERYGEHGLLRSLAIAADWRDRGIGAALVGRALEEARAAGLADLWLLTTTAAPWFLRFGFRPVARGRLPAALATSAELRGACPASALAMHRALGREASGTTG